MSLTLSGTSLRLRSCCATYCGGWSDPNAGVVHERNQPISHFAGVVLHGSTDAAAAGESPHHRKLPRHLSPADAICTAAVTQGTFTVDHAGFGYSVPRRFSRSS